MCVRVFAPIGRCILCGLLLFKQFCQFLGGRSLTWRQELLSNVFISELFSNVFFVVVFVAPGGSTVVPQKCIVLLLLLLMLVVVVVYAAVDATVVVTGVQLVLQLWFWN